ncbi:hypothetical protein C8R46DRAFT_1117625 [Mycena filopes]|nr:hypothetical protein C8R46DRAFT_1117625 [Mycena filopes]
MSATSPLSCFPTLVTLCFLLVVPLSNPLKLALKSSVFAHHACYRVWIHPRRWSRSVSHQRPPLPSGLRGWSASRSVFLVLPVQDLSQPSCLSKEGL